MGFFSIDMECNSCGWRGPLLTTRDRAADWNTVYDCPDCKEKAGKRILSMPNTTKESYVDGHKRGGDYALLKESARLQLKAASAKGDTKKELLKAAKELKTSAKKEKGKVT